MTAIELCVVIGILVAYMAILYLPFDKKKKVVYIFVVLMTATIIGMVGYDKEEGKNHLPYNCEEIIQRNPYAKETLMAAYNLSEVDFEAAIPFKDVSPIEKMVGSMVAVALVCTPMLMFAVKDDTEKEIEKVQKSVFALCAVATALLLSLFYGLKLMIVPVYKKAFGKAEKSSQVLN